MVTSRKKLGDNAADLAAGGLVYLEDYGHGGSFFEGGDRGDGAVVWAAVLLVLWTWGPGTVGVG